MGWGVTGAFALLAAPFYVDRQGVLYTGAILKLSSEVEAAVRRVPCHVGGSLNDHLPFPEQSWKVMVLPPEAYDAFSHT